MAISSFTLSTILKTGRSSSTSSSSPSSSPPLPPHGPAEGSFLHLLFPLPLLLLFCTPLRSSLNRRRVTDVIGAAVCCVTIAQALRGAPSRRRRLTHIDRTSFLPLLSPFFDPMIAYLSPALLSSASFPLRRSSYPHFFTTTFHFHFPLFNDDARTTWLCIIYLHVRFKGNRSDSFSFSPLLAIQ